MGCYREIYFVIKNKNYVLGLAGMSCTRIFYFFIKNCVIFWVICDVMFVNFWENNNEFCIIFYIFDGDLKTECFWGSLNFEIWFFMLNVFEWNLILCFKNYIISLVFPLNSKNVKPEKKISGFTSCETGFMWIRKCETGNVKPDTTILFYCLYHKYFTNDNK